ncbi:MAG TPA: hypothetical protein VEK57_14330 [Thermoanaerobaculia bacterium]|nr:hypothetical protein [Thermoanaerobaculia bacterium]
MRKILLAFSLLVAPALLAQTADLRITTATLSTTPTVTGERVALSLVWRNDGPDTAHTVHVSVTGSPTPFYLLSVATSGWPCYPNLEGTSFLCQNVMLEPGAEANLVLHVLTPPVAGTFTLRAAVSADEPDPTPTNNVVQFTADLAASPLADLSITPTSQVHRVSENDPVSLPVSVTNHGDVDVRNVVAYFSVPVSSNPQPFTVAGEGWSCGNLAYGPQAVVCTRPSLAANGVAPLTVTTTAPSTDFTLYARLRGELHADPLLANDTATATIQVSDTVPEQEGWSRILVPLGGPDVPGSGNSLWRVENTGVILADLEIETQPDPCPPPTLCALPTRMAFDITELLAGGSTGSIIYVRESDAHKLRINSRVYDVARQEQTAGAEIPVVRDEEFSSAPMSIVGIPVASHYRHTLRVYDIDAIPGALVRIHLYLNGEDTPRVSVLRELTVSEGPTLPTLPLRPGYLQLELGQLLALPAGGTVRVDIEPTDPALKLWSFVSVTNNDTHHVTTFSAQ